jgi:tetratricopeptide (TPR) repeat protein
MARLAAERAPDSADVLTLCGECAVASEHNPLKKFEAARDFRAAVSLAPNHAGALLGLSRLCRAAGRFDRANELLDKAARAHPKHWEIHLARARVAIAQKDADAAWRAIETARTLTRGVMPQPHILAGRLLYAQGELEKGKKAFETAIRIHPVNLQAHVGIPDYHRLKGDKQAVVEAWNAILARFPGSPQAFLARADDLHAMGMTRQAISWYVKAFLAYKNMYLTPPETIFTTVGDLHMRLTRDYPNAVTTYATYLFYHPNNPRVAEIHRTLGKLQLQQFNQPGIAGAHFRQVLSLLPEDAETLKLIDAHPLRPLSLAGIKAMIKHDYPVRIIAEMVEDTPLNFACRTREERVALVYEREIPRRIVDDIAESTRRADEGVGRPGTPERIQRLLGDWSAVVGGPRDGVKGLMTLSFREDGRYTMTASIGPRMTLTSRGAYTVTDKTITGRRLNGTDFVYAYRFEGDNLLLDIPELGGRTAFQRKTPAD